MFRNIEKRLLIISMKNVRKNIEICKECFKSFWFHAVEFVGNAVYFYIFGHKTSVVVGIPSAWLIVSRDFHTTVGVDGGEAVSYKTVFAPIRTFIVTPKKHNIPYLRRLSESCIYQITNFKSWKHRARSNVPAFVSLIHPSVHEKQRHQKEKARYG